MPDPGWYPDPYGQMRWWDGQTWGVAAPVAAYGAGGDPKQTAMIAELLGLFTGWLGPLIMHTTNKSPDPFVRHHITEALNFHLTVLLATFVCIPLMFVLVGFLLFPVVAIGSFVCSIQATLAANRGDWYRYPVAIRFVKNE